MQKQTITLKFEKLKFEANESSIINIASEVEFINGYPKLESSELIELSVINSENNKETYAYVLNTEKNKQSLVTLNLNYDKQSLANCDFSFESGYGFTGNCFVYGHFITGNNCETIFIPCGYNCIGFNDVCPDWNEAYANILNK